jgi:hypothetical protein
MSAEESLPEGCQYCNCHPETCCHNNGMVYVPTIETEEDREDCKFYKKHDKCKNDYHPKWCGGVCPYFKKKKSKK